MCPFLCLCPNYRGTEITAISPLPPLYYQDTDSPLPCIGAQEKAGVGGWSWEVAVRGTLRPWLPLLLGHPVRGLDPGCGGTFTGFSIHSGDQ